MGFPLSTFQQLSLLCREEPFIRQTFERYRMTAVIVHDPSDDSFRRQVKYSFEYLHEVTGEGFAFITFINPPARWAQAHTNWMDLREQLSVGNGLDDDGFVQALRRRLDLPDGPSLVLSDGLLSNRYVILPSSHDEVISQMEDIGEFVNSRPGRFPVDSPEFLAFLSDLGPAFAECTVDGASLAKNIADLAAVRALTGAGAARDRMARQVQVSDAHQYVRDELRSLWEDLKQWRKTGAGDDTDGIMDRLSDYLAQIVDTARIGNPRHPNAHAGRRRQDIEDSDYDCYSLTQADTYEMEPLTRTYLSYYNMLLPLYLGTDIYGRSSKVDMELITPAGLISDFSPLGSYLGKAVEEEMNASLVQRARQLMGVHMPHFYRRFEETLNDRCEVRTNQKRIYLNWRGRRLSATDFADRSLPIGEVLCVLRELAADEDKGRMMGQFCDEASIERADSFARLRNAACHTGLFGRDGFDRMYNSFRELRRLDFPGMFRLKSCLRNTPERSHLFEII